MGLGEALLAWAEPVRNFLVFVGIRSERKKICCEDEDDVIIHSCHLFAVLNCVSFPWELAQYFPLAQLFAVVTKNQIYFPQSILGTAPNFQLVPFFAAGLKMSTEACLPPSGGAGN